MGSGRGWGAVLLLLVAAACTLEGRREGAGAGGYDVTIRRDGHGVPHIVAGDFGSLGYGEGYAFAQDHACTLADQVLRARGERARLLVSGQTGDQASPRFWEQTELYAAKRWRDVRFSDEEIRADPGLTVTTLRGYLIPTSSTSKISVAPGGITPAAPRSP